MSLYQSLIIGWS